MEHYAEIDVSLELSSVCIVDTQGKIVKETKVAGACQIDGLAGSASIVGCAQARNESAA
jgi:hypothetical protein